MFGKTTVLEISKNSYKNIFCGDPFKQFELFNLSSFYAIRVAEMSNILPRAMAIAFCEQEFLKLLEERLWWDHILVKSNRISAFFKTLMKTLSRVLVCAEV